MSLPWLYLIVAGLLEVGWAVGLKYTDGFTRLAPSILTLIAMVGSLGMLSLALRQIPIGTAYAIWTGIGAVGVALLGIVLFGDSRETLRIVFILLIVIGIIGLKLVS